MTEEPSTSQPVGNNSHLNTLVSRLSERWPSLPDKPEETPLAAIRALWFTAAGQNRSVQKASEGELPALSPDIENRLNHLIGQRLSGMPLAHLTGWQNFMGLEFKAGPQALIPRKETEILGNTASKYLRDIVGQRGRATIIDLCTGCGNLAISLAARETGCRVFAADLCADAVALAKENAAFHELQERVDFRCGDLFEPFAQGHFDGVVDLVVCNPPYLSAKKAGALPREIAAFEPLAAFDAGSFGLSVINRLVNEAPRYLKPDSWLCFEVGLGQGTFLASRLERHESYRTVETVVDASGEVRAVVART